MKKMLFAITAGLLLALPASCMHGYRGGPGGRDCQKHHGCNSKCGQQPDCPKPDCPSRPDCPQQQAPAAK